MKKLIFLKKWMSHLLLACIIIYFSNAVSNLQQDHSAQDKAQLQDALTRAAVTCYAAEGVYPPDLDYLTEHYGIQINDDLYIVKYEVIASNLMPDITVLEKQP